MFIEIFSYLDAASLARASLTCRKWQSLCLDHHLWKQLFLKDFPVSAELFSKDELTKNLYEFYEIDRRIRSHDLSPHLSLICTNKNEIQSLHLRDDNIFGLFKDNTLLIWNISTGDCIQKIEGFNKEKDAFGFFDEFDPSGAVQETQEKIITMDPFQVQIYDVKTSSMIKKSFNEKIYSFQASQGEIFGGGLHNIKIWNLITGKEIQILKDHKSSFHCLQSNEEKIISSSLDHTLRVWDSKDGSELLQIKDSQDIYTCLAVQEGKIFAGTFEGDVKIWDSETGIFIRRLKGHAATVRCLDVADGKIVSGSYDGTVRIWDFKKIYPLKRKNNERIDSDNGYLDKRLPKFKKN